MKRLLLVAVVLQCVVAPGRSSGQAQQQQQAPPPPQRQPDFRERYGVLVERNIFLRNRSRPTTRSSGTNPSSNPSSRSARRPEQSYLLTGIILEEGRRVAFIENPSAGTTERLVVGAPIARGKIVAVDFHYLEFESASGERTKVEVGKTLAGDERGTAVASTQPSSSDASAPIDPNNPNLTRAELLKLRRQQELPR